MEPPQRRFLFPFVAGAFVLALGAWILLRQDKPAPAAATAPPTDSATPAREPSELPAITTLPAAAELSATLNRPDSNPEEDLDAVAQLIYVYRQGFGENPVGQNEDVVAALLGANEKRTAYLPADSPAIVEGKLVDRWGSPYWFHPVSGREMEIRSAGPDRELFTGDDIALP
jgi:hypothetical protein